MPRESALLLVRAALPGIAGLLLADLAGALAKHRFLRRHRPEPRRQLRALQLQRLIGERAILRRQAGELGRSGEPRLAGALGKQSRALGKQGQIIAGQRALVGAKIGCGHFDQHLRRPDRLPFADVDRSDHAALAVLDRLAVARNRDHALCVDARVERRQRGPAEQDDEEEDDDRSADADVAARVVARGRQCRSPTI